MLLTLTSMFDFSAMALTFWLGLYLLGKSFPHPVSLRAVVSLLAISAFFLGAYTNLFEQFRGMAAWRAVLLIIGLGSWFSLICKIIPQPRRLQFIWLERGVYLLGLLSAILLLSTRNAFIGELGNELSVAHMDFGLPFTLYGVYQIVVAATLLFHLLTGERFGLTSSGRYFLLASIFPALAVSYGVTGLISPIALPRIIQDFLTFCGVFLLGTAVAHHQTLVERRILLPDFPVSGFFILGLSSVYGFLAWQWNQDHQLLALVMMLAILTHSIQDYAHEYLDRLRIHQDSAFRQKLRDFKNENTSDQTLHLHIKMGLELLCQTLQASSGFVTLKNDEAFLVIASHKSISPGSEIPPEQLITDEIVKFEHPQFPNVEWIAPFFAGQAQIGAIGLGKPRTRLDYSADDLDLLVDVADRIGTLVLQNNPYLSQAGSAEQQTSAPISENSGFDTSSDDLVLTITTSPDAEFIKMIEDDLRHITDYIALGQSPLADRIGIQGTSHIERGKNLQKILLAAIEELRPTGPRPKQPLPRVWYSYVVLNDAYVEGEPNREIMARLFISEGTFNRTRRNALRGLARWLLEKNQTGPWQP